MQVDGEARLYQTLRRSNMLWALLRQDGSLLEGLILESHDAVVHVHCYQVPIVFANHAMIYEMCRSGTFSSHHCYLESRDVILRTCIHRSSYSSLLLLATCSPDPRQETGSQYGCASPSLQYPRCNKPSSILMRDLVSGLVCFNHWQGTESKLRTEPMACIHLGLLMICG